MGVGICFIYGFGLADFRGLASKTPKKNQSKQNIVIRRFWRCIVTDHWEDDIHERPTGEPIQSASAAVSEDPEPKLKWRLSIM
jgi:hypothetical protein